MPPRAEVSVVVASWAMGMWIFKGPNMGGGILTHPPHPPPGVHMGATHRHRWGGAVSQAAEAGCGGAWRGGRAQGQVGGLGEGGVPVRPASHQNFDPPQLRTSVPSG